MAENDAKRKPIGPARQGNVEWQVAPDLQEDLPWNPMPGEPVRWFAVFDHYRLCGPARSLIAAWRSYQVAIGNPKNPLEILINNRLREMAVKWQWAERADAWDLAEMSRKRKEAAEQAEENRERRIVLLKRSLDKLQVALELADPARVKLGEVVNAIRMVVTELRFEYGQQPAGQFALTEEEANLAIERALAELSARSQDAVIGNVAD